MKTRKARQLPCGRLTVFDAEAPALLVLAALRL